MNEDQPLIYPDTKYVIHIGLNKTGTSSLQAFLLQNKRILDEQGWSYPDQFLDNCAHHDYAKLISKHTKPITNNEIELKKIIKTIKDQNQRVILSSEFFWAGVNPRYLAETFPIEETQIVVYFRNILHHYKSWYQEDINATNLTSHIDQYVFTQSISLSKIAAQKEWLRTYGRKRMIIKE